MSGKERHLFVEWRLVANLERLQQIVPSVLMAPNANYDIFPIRLILWDVGVNHLRYPEFI